MARERQEGRGISRRRFIGLGLGLVGAGVIAAVSEPRAVIASEKPAIAVAETINRKSDWEIMQEAKQARIQKFITESDALVKRFGHANY